MGALDLLIEQMPNSALQSTRVYWRDMLHMEQRKEDQVWANEKFTSDPKWFSKNGKFRGAA